MAHASRLFKNCPEKNHPLGLSLSETNGENVLRRYFRVHFIPLWVTILTHKMVIDRLVKAYESVRFWGMITSLTLNEKDSTLNWRSAFFSEMRECDLNVAHV